MSVDVEAAREELGRILSSDDASYRRGIALIWCQDRGPALLDEVESLRERLAKAEGALTKLLAGINDYDDMSYHDQLFQERIMDNAEEACEIINKPWGYWREVERQTDRDRGGEVNRPCPP